MSFCGVTARSLQDADAGIEKVRVQDPDESVMKVVSIIGGLCASDQSS